MLSLRGFCFGGSAFFGLHGGKSNPVAWAGFGEFVEKMMSIEQVMDHGRLYPDIVVINSPPSSEHLAIYLQEPKKFSLLDSS